MTRQAICVVVVALLAVSVAADCGADGHGWGSHMTVLSDVDDTLYAGGAAMNTDATVPKGTFYDGVMDFILAVSEGNGRNGVRQGGRPSNFMLLSARPAQALVKSLKSHTEGATVKAIGDFSDAQKGPFPHETRLQPTWGLGGALYGGKLDALRGQTARMTVFGDRKFKNFETFVAKGGSAGLYYNFPSNMNPTGEQTNRCYAFMGDDGQGDELAGIKMLTKYGPPDVRDPQHTAQPFLVKGVFIHNVKRLNGGTGGYFAKFKRPTNECSVYEHVNKYIHYFDTYRGAALAAYTSGVIDMWGAARVLMSSYWEEACDDFDSMAQTTPTPKPETDSDFKSFVIKTRLCQIAANDVAALAERLTADLAEPTVVIQHHSDQHIENLRVLRGERLADPRTRFDGRIFVASCKIYDDNLQQLVEAPDMLPVSDPRWEAGFDGVACSNDEVKDDLTGCYVSTFKALAKLAFSVKGTDSTYTVPLTLNVAVDSFIRGYWTQETLLQVGYSADRCGAEPDSRKRERCAKEVSVGVFGIHRDGLNSQQIPNGPHRYGAYASIGNSGDFIQGKPPLQWALSDKIGDAMSILGRIVESRVLYSHRKPSLDDSLAELKPFAKDLQVEKCMARAEGGGSEPEEDEVEWFDAEEPTDEDLNDEGPTHLQGTRVGGTGAALTHTNAIRGIVRIDDYLPPYNSKDDTDPLSSDHDASDAGLSTSDSGSNSDRDDSDSGRNNSDSPIGRPAARLRLAGPNYDHDDSDSGRSDSDSLIGRPAAGLRQAVSPEWGALDREEDYGTPTGVVAGHQ